MTGMFLGSLDLLISYSDLLLYSLKSFVCSHFLYFSIFLINIEETFCGSSFWVRSESDQLLNKNVSVLFDFLMILLNWLFCWICWKARLLDRYDLYESLSACVVLALSESPFNLLSIDSNFSLILLSIKCSNMFDSSIQWVLFFTSSGSIYSSA